MSNPPHSFVSSKLRSPVDQTAENVGSFRSHSPSLELGILTLALHVSVYGTLLALVKRSGWAYLSVFAMHGYLLYGSLSHLCVRGWSLSFKAVIKLESMRLYRV